MSSELASKLTEHPKAAAAPWRWRLSLWPQSLFGRLIAAVVIAVFLAQAAGLVLIARDRERFVLQGTVREWARRIAEMTLQLQSLSSKDRAAMVTRLIEQRRRFDHPPPGGATFGWHGPMGEELVFSYRTDPGGAGTSRGASGAPLGPEGPPEPGVPRGPHRPPGDLQGPPSDLSSELQSRLPHEVGHHVGPRGLFSSPDIFIPMPLPFDFQSALMQQLQATLGSAFTISIAPTADPSKRAIPVMAGPFEPHEGQSQPYDVSIRYPDGDTTVFRVARTALGAPLPRSLLTNLILLVVIMIVALYVSARGITRPLSELAQAAERLGRGARQPKLEEKGAREVRDAARAFNTMQDRLHRYLDSRTRVLAAMSHDLKTPLTRLRLQVETQLDDPAVQARFGKELDEMESMVRGALALFRGLNDDEALAPVDMNALLSTLKSEFVEMGEDVTVEGQARDRLVGKPQALKRCLTNLIANAVKFGRKAAISVRDGAALVIQIRDDGPGIPPDELERVFEPFYRVESSRNRDTGGTGLGLSIARDVAQAHGGSLSLRNLPERGLEAVLTLSRRP